MAIVTKDHDASGQLNTTGRAAQLITLSKTNITQAELNAIVAFIQLTNTISGISTFTAGTTDVVYMMCEGPAVAAGSDFAAQTGVTSASVANFA
jgi:hypothetical protein